MRALIALCRKELILLSRDPHGLLVLFAVPILFILIMSLALRDVFRAEIAPSLKLQLIDQDGGQLARDYKTRLAELDPEAGTAAAPVRIVLLQGFSELLASRNDFAAEFRAGEIEPTLMRIDLPAGAPPQLRATAGLLARQALIAVQTEYLLSQLLDLKPEQRDAMRYLADPRHLPVQERFVGSDGRVMTPPTSVQQNVPAWLAFAMFFAVIPLATAFVIEAAQGSLLRLRALGVRPATLLASKALPYYGVHMLQLVMMFAVGVWAVPALGGDRLTLGSSLFGLWMIASATSLAAIGLALLVAVQVRTTLQATIAGGAISLLLAAIGGVMVPKIAMPPAMQALTTLSPMAWSLEGFWDLVLRQGRWQDALPEAGALAAFGLACLALAALRLRRAFFASTTTL